MRFSVKISVSVLLILLLGLLQRVFFAAFCHAITSSISELVLSLLTGLIYDLSFTSGLLLVLFVLSFVLNEKTLHVILFVFLFLWLLLGAVDLLAYNYTGVRAGLNLLNLFSVADLIKKAEWSSITLALLFYLILFIGLLVYIRRKLKVPFAIPLNHKLFTVLTLTLCTLVYLPYPLVYYSDQLGISKEMRQLALNPVFSWSSSLLYQAEAYPINPQQAISTYKRENQIRNTRDKFFLKELDYSKEPAYDKVVLIMMESFGANRIGALHGKKALSPGFDSLCREGELFTRCFSCGPRTQYAVSSILYGFPHILGYNLFRQNKQKLPFKGLMSLLATMGYQNHFLHGGSAAYDDMQLFLTANDPIEIRDMDSITSYAFKNKWGVDDGAFFKYSANYIAQQKGKNSYYLLSMSNHEPFELPASFNVGDELKDLSAAEKTFLYADQQLLAFINRLKQDGSYNKTLIIITGDHAEHYAGEDNDLKLFHVPLLVIDHKHTGVNDVPVSHADVAGFILSKTGFNGKSHLLSRNPPFAPTGQVFCRNYNSEVFMVSDKEVYRYNLNNKELYRILCNKNMYTLGTQLIKPDLPEYQKISNNILVNYTVNRFIFENGLYSPQ